MARWLHCALPLSRTEIPLRGASRGDMRRSYLSASLQPRPLHLFALSRDELFQSATHTSPLLGLRAHSDAHSHQSKAQSPPKLRPLPQSPLCLLICPFPPQASGRPGLCLCHWFSVGRCKPCKHHPKHWPSLGSENLAEKARAPC